VKLLEWLIADTDNTFLLLIKGTIATALVALVIAIFFGFPLEVFIAILAGIAVKEIWTSVKNKYKSGAG